MADKNQCVNVDELKQLARGQWPEIITAIGGVASELLDGKGHPCPKKCSDGGGDDRFSVFKDFNETGGVICRHCHSEKNGDGIATLQWLTGWGFAETIDKVAEYLGADQKPHTVTQRAANDPPRKKPGRIFSTADEAIKNLERDPNLGPRSACWTYRDKRGEPVGYVVRWDTADGKTIRPVSRYGDRWHVGAMQDPRPLYRLPEVLESEGPVYICEGEKATDAAVSIGLNATTSSGGSNAPNKTDWEPLHGREVVILPDNDESGRKYANTVAENLILLDVRYDLPPSATVKVVELPGLPEKGDIVEWIEAQDTTDPEELRGRIEKLADEADLWQPGESKPEPWPEPVGFGPNLPIFPIDCLPVVLRDWAASVAESTQVPVDLPAMLCLAVCATAIAKRVEVDCGRGWSEPTNIFVVVVLDPANRKSAVFKLAVAPLVRHEKEEAIRLADQIRRAENDRDIHERRLENQKKAVAKESDRTKRDEISSEIEETSKTLEEIEDIVAPRLFADDITVEQLAVLMMRHGGRMAVLSAEGNIFEIFTGAYTNNSDARLGVALQGHAGDPLRSDRVGRTEVNIDDPALTLGLTVQTDVINSLGESKKLRGRGLIGRCLFALPESPLGRRKIDPAPVPDHIRQSYEDMVLKLCQLEELVSVMLSPEADRMFTDFRRWVEPQLAEAGGELAYMSDWAGKLPGAVARIAGILHTVEHIDDDIELPIRGDTMRAAIAIGRYLIPHAQAAIEATQQATPTSHCQIVLGWIKRKGEPTFSQRDAHRYLARHFNKSEDLDGPLERIVEHGFIRLLPSDSPSDKRGRKPSPKYEVWPGLFKSENNFKTPETVDRNDRIDDWPPDNPEKSNSVNCVNAFGQIENESGKAPDDVWGSI